MPAVTNLWVDADKKESVMVWALGTKTPYLYNIGSEPLDGDFQKVAPIDRTPDGGDLPGGMGSGRPVHPEHIPTKMRWENAKYEIPDFENPWRTSVSERAKALLEKFEPDTHQFFPVEYYSKAGTLLEKRYFLVVCNRIDSLDHETTTMVFVRDEHGAYWLPVFDLVARGRVHLIPPHLPHDTKSKLVFNRGKIGAHRMWVDKYLLGGGGTWISDELAAALKASDLTGLDLREMETV